MKICCFSDTHSFHRQVLFSESCDVLVYAGDISNKGEMAILEDFNNMCKELKKKGLCKEVIVIAGNHDITLDPKKVGKESSLSFEKIFSNCIYLNQRAHVIDGITFYGDPRTADFFPEIWAFNVNRGKLKEEWDKIPKDVDVIITHSPPYGIRDLLIEKFRKEGEDPHVGCRDLREKAFNMKGLKAHVFGHIHSGYGVTRMNGVKFVNPCICSDDNIPINFPIIIEI